MREMKSPATAGFTLIEMLVALTMAAAVVTPLFIVTRGISETSSSKQMEVEAMQRARTAMDLLVRDFSRAGLFTSPNTATDSRYYNRDTSGSSVQFRAAVVHFNRGASTTGSDVVSITGNFLGSNSYSAYATNQFVLMIPNGIDTEEACLRQFDPRYAVAHISGNDGRNLEARITNAVFGANSCTITIANIDYNPRSYRMGDYVQVSSNQTAIYMVEGTDLVRYFVAPANPGAANGGECDIEIPFADYTDVNISTGTIIPSTRQVFGSYVVNFQVWFRPVTQLAWTTPHYHTVAEITGQASGNFANGFKLPEAKHVIPLAPDGDINESDVSCEALDETAGGIRPERVRSAMIQLSVRSEKSDGNMRWIEDDTEGPGRLVSQSLTPDDSIPVGEGELPFVYQVRTLTTEVEMPNLAARADLLR